MVVRRNGGVWGEPYAHEHLSRSCRLRPEGWHELAKSRDPFHYYRPFPWLHTIDFEVKMIFVR